MIEFEGDGGNNQTSSTWYFVPRRTHKGMSETTKKLEHVSLKKVTATLERKDFDFELARNCRGPVVRIIERGPAGRKDMVIAPGTIECIDQIVGALQQL